MPAGLGGSGKVGFAFEDVMGVYEPPTVFVPVLNEDLQYREDKYKSEQIRQQTIHSDVKPAPYHVEGTVEMEVDVNNLPYWLYASRHNITKTGAGPYTYKFTPGNQGSASTAASGAVARTASITVVRNGVVFGYVGCVVGSFEFTLTDEQILTVSMDVLGMGEEEQSAPSPTWVAPQLYGAEAHNVYLAAAAAAPTFGAADVNFDGFTFRTNFNAEAQNRIRADRQASYISFGITEAEIESSLDFLDRTDYDNMVNNTFRAIKLESTENGEAFATADHGVKLQGNRVSFDTYEVNLDGMGDLIMADFSGSIIGIAGGDAYQIEVKTAVNIT